MKRRMRVDGLEGDVDRTDGGGVEMGCVGARGILPRVYTRPRCGCGLHRGRFAGGYRFHDRESAANATIDIIVAAVNNGGEGARSEAVRIVTH